MPFSVPTHQEYVAPVGPGGVPVLESYTKNNSGEASSPDLVLTKPASVAVGDLLLIFIGNDEPSAKTWPALTGWNQLYDASSASSDCGFAIHWRIADGNESATETVDSNINDAQVFGWYMRITGAHQTTPINVAAPFHVIGSNHEHEIPEVTTTVADCLAFYVLAFDGGDGMPFDVVGAGWAQEDEQQNGTTGGLASGCFGTKEMPVAGATGAATVTSDGVADGSTSAQFAIAST